MAAAGGGDIVVDRVEFNATRGGTLTWEPGNTIMGDASAPGPGRILQRTNCQDTNQPQDFTLAVEPGLPANGAPTVAIVVPAPGQNVPAATAVTLTWTMSDDVFLSGYLHVWANVTIGNATIGLVSDRMGVTSTVWTPPDVDAANVVLRIEVEDPFGAHAQASTTFALSRQSPVVLIVAVLIAVVLLVFLIFGFRRTRKHETGQRSPPPTPPTPPSTAPPVVPPIGAALSRAEKKTCPRCHTAVDAGDVTCFFCGYKFGEPNAPP